MTVHRASQNRVAAQIAVCDAVLARLTQLDDPTLEGLIEDVEGLRGSLQQLLASGDGDGSPPSL